MLLLCYLLLRANAKIHISPALYGYIPKNALFTDEGEELLQRNPPSVCIYTYMYSLFTFFLMHLSSVSVSLFLNALVEIGGD